MALKKKNSKSNVKNSGKKNNLATGKDKKQNDKNKKFNNEIEDDFEEQQPKKKWLSRKKFKMEMEAKALEKKKKKSKYQKDEDEEFETVPQTNDDYDDISEDETDDEEYDSAISEPFSDNSDNEQKMNNEYNNESDVDDNEDEDEDEEDEDEDEDEDTEDEEIERKLREANRKHKKSGGFQSMGLSSFVYKAIIHKGYKVPTPIQRKTIPIILEGKDVVAMARTGSGKTASFLIPIIEKLKAHSVKVGVRALILSPTRELAIQTLKFVKDFGKYTDLRTCVIVGGDNMEEQFSAIAGNPDIIIATPGRLMHLIIEMNYDLKTVQHVVFDEADRLFEMGFEEQLKEILFKLPQERQTILFSATLPRLLVDFAKAGLTDPSLIRLDVDSKMSKDLQAAFFSVKRIEKESALLFLLKHVIKENESTIVFAATKHHVEYLHELLDKANIDNTYIYGSLDQTARKINISKFRNGTSKILIVTDVAARGIDIPLLENVINYDFPTSSKIFIHRVGRAARAGRKGVAYSFVSSDEMPYFIDLQLFTGRPLKLAIDYEDGEEPDYTTEIVYGNIPQDSLDMETSYIEKLIKSSVTLEGLKKVTQNAYKLYYKTRAKASSESYIHAKELVEKFAGIHPILSSVIDKDEIERAKIVNSLTSFRPHETIFEVGKRGLKSAEAQLVQKRRSQIFSIIEARQEKIAKAEAKKAQMQANKVKKVDEVNEEELEKTFKNISSKKRKRENTDFRDKEYYMSHYQQGVEAERGYGVNGNGGIGSSSFIEQMGSATMDLMGDDDKALKKNQKGALKWDTKKKRFIRETIGSDNKKRIKTESGNIIPASYKSKRFEEWQKKTKIEIPRSGEKELENSANAADMSQLYKSRRIVHTKMTPGNPNSKNQQRKKARLEAEARREGKSDSNTVTIKKHKGRRLRVVKHKTIGDHAKNELRTAVQITKDRKIKEKRREKNGRHNIKKKK
ncbi:DEAD-domain-containing protein [Neocallimastix lanati (nom. inval.)]|jgi:ATP-dependent RNA helicase DDX54/DBP10|uniref:RNA helicase n=1 Tax=Neocallimastix californiae TaxID=1754190 RepID=A0A1Y2AMU0_9FUNG|nr:DEAD-domain-containing protein [Neocallimastix sp. JGI-2020a]ORY23871.1 DEAD-domain-containing protein [Neocallimastix californiae]|eukprot:ORY23871.1 DEAD-domain-containing protein [Neocallimastix californiae]